MVMHRRTLQKPDGRLLHLYSHTGPISERIEATAPRTEVGSPPQPHLRWHPLRGEWVIYASHRQNRTFLPPRDYSPLAVTKSPDFPTELPAGDYEVAVFENLFPALSSYSREVPSLEVPTAPGKGVCEVVVFTQDPDEHLASLPLDRIQLILEVLGERTRELGSREEVRYVLPFENRGVEMGVTLHHPHGQIYGYPFIPPVPERMLERMREHQGQTGRGLLEDLIRTELRDQSRLIRTAPHALSFVPICARYPYETWVAPMRPVAFLHELQADERRDLAWVLRETLRCHDALWDRVQPYLMLLYQAPTDGSNHPEAHLHFQIYPPYRTRDKLKFLAGTELGAGIFVNDSIPEEKAAELREACFREGERS